MATNVTQISPSHAGIPQQNPSPATPHRSQPWYQAYMDALFETDRSRMAERIKRAEHLIITRERQLFHSPNRSSEQRALDNALHALRALRSCFGC